ncbi:acyltransferase [Kitasatospora sp. NPDC058965]|uniref:acyltransferase n=1 Tax=Kitasatospora sp. NPDC058965 TaxID=3346682 RepID=UPI0036A8D6EB
MADLTRTVKAGRADGTIVRLALPDLMLADLAVSVVLCFPRALDPEPLATALARALERVPLFGGRLRTVPGGLELVCSDAGVPFGTAESPDTRAEVLPRLPRGGGGYTDPLPAAAARTEDLPLLSVRLTRLADGGSVLGCSWHHAVGDIASFTVLLRAWSAELEGTGAADPEPLVTDRTALLESVLPARDSGRPGFRLPGPAEAALLAREVAQAPLANRTVQLHFTEDEVDRMRAAFGPGISANDAICAQVLSTVRALDGHQDAQRLVVPVNLRRFLGLPPLLLGNLLGEICLDSPAGQSPAELAGELRAAVADFTRSQLSLRSSLDFLAGAGPERLADCVPLGFDPARRTFTLSSWCRSGVHGLTFQGQHPEFFGPAGNLPLPWVSWLVEGVGGHGYLLTAVLPARLAGRLRSPAGRAALHPHRDPAPA